MPATGTVISASVGNGEPVGTKHDFTQRGTSHISLLPEFQDRSRSSQASFAQPECPELTEENQVVLEENPTRIRAENTQGNNRTGKDQYGAEPGVGLGGQCRGLGTGDEEQAPRPLLSSVSARLWFSLLLVLTSVAPRVKAAG